MRSATHPQLVRFHRSKCLWWGVATLRDRGPLNSYGGCEEGGAKEIPIDILTNGGKACARRRDMKGTCSLDQLTISIRSLAIGFRFRSRSVSLDVIGMKKSMGQKRTEKILSHKHVSSTCTPATQCHPAARMSLNMDVYRNSTVLHKCRFALARCIGRSSLFVF